MREIIAEALNMFSAEFVRKYVRWYNRREKRR
jgi:hypothetical protein